MSKKNLLIITFMIVLGIIAIVVFGIVHNLRNKGCINISGILEAKTTEVPSLVSGIVKKVLVQEGQNIEAGQPILVLDVSQLKLQRDEALSVVKQAQASLEILKSGASAADVRQLEAKVKQAQANYNNIASGTRPQQIETAKVAFNQAKEQLETAKRLFDKDVVPKIQLDAAQAKFDDAKAQLDLLKQGATKAQVDIAKQQISEAKAALSKVYEGARPGDIKAAQAKIDQAKAEMLLIDQMISQSEIKSPASGTLSQVTVNDGEVITKGTTVATITNLNNLWVKIFVPESKLVYIAEGQPTTIYPEAMPDILFPGKITFISQQGAFIPPGTKESTDQQVFEVKVSLLKTDSNSIKLRPGMTVRVKSDHKSCKNKTID